MDNLRNTMNNIHLANLRMQTNARYSDNMFDVVVLLWVLIAVFISSVTMAVMDNFDKKAVLPLTTHDTCHATSVSKSLTSNNVMRRTSSRDNIVIAI